MSVRELRVLADIAWRSGDWAEFARLRELAVVS